MKTKLTKLMALLLAAVLVLGLCACSKEDGGKTSGNGSNTENSAAGNESSSKDESKNDAGTEEKKDENISTGNNEGKTEENKGSETDNNTVNTEDKNSDKGSEEAETVPDITDAPVASATTITDMIGREVEIVPGSYKRVVCIGAGALRMYSYIGNVDLLCGVEDIDNTTLEERPKMFDSVARPYVLAYGDKFNTLPSCGVGGPNAQAAEAEKILSCNPDIVISEYEDVEKEDALQEQLGVPVITLKAGPGGVFDPSFAGTMKLL